MDIMDLKASTSHVWNAISSNFSPKAKVRQYRREICLAGRPSTKNLPHFCAQIPRRLIPQAAFAHRSKNEADPSQKTAQKASSGVRSLRPKWREIQGANDWQGMLDPLDPDLRSELIRNGQFAQACFDGFDGDSYSRHFGSCKYDSDNLFAGIGLPNCGYEITKYLYTPSEGSQLFGKSDLEENLWSRDSYWIGFVAVSTSSAEIERLGRRDILVAWRGTVLSFEWIRNFKDYLQTTGLHSTDKNIKVESGFLAAYTSSKKYSKFCSDSARDQLLTEIKRLTEKFRGEELSITLTGHGLGGALAVLSASDIAEQGLNRGIDEENGADIPVTVFSFGAPRLGNEAFKNRCLEKGLKILRIANSKDLVPKVPGIVFNEKFPLLKYMPPNMPWTYSHVGTPLILDSSHSPFLKSTVDPTCQHNLEAYLHLIDGYHGPNLPFESATNRDHALVNKTSNFLKEEYRIPPHWWKEQHKGMILNEKGRWVQFYQGTRS